jgi:glycosyltransferase involved in cell wall biosynthesis
MLQIRSFRGGKWIDDMCNPMLQMSIFIAIISNLEILPKISIVTISFNQGKYLEKTITSVLDQHYPNLEYIIIDGGSTDGSVEIIKKYEKKLTYWVSEPDNGLYHAVEKGLNKCTGEIMAWINSDDFYLPDAFRNVAKVFNENRQVNWIRGLAVEAKENGDLVKRITIPWCRWSRYRYLTNDFQFIQQESSFWRRKVWDGAGRKMEGSIRYAGDMELWARFFRREKLYTAAVELAAFRLRGENQISVNKQKEYIQECMTIVKRERKLLSGAQRIYLLFLWWAKWWNGLCFYLNIPFFNLFYPFFFKIPALIKTGSNQLPFTKGVAKIKIPPMIIGKWVIQRKPFKWID